jgi:hypothetical protein
MTDTDVLEARAAATTPRRSTPRRSTPRPDAVDDGTMIEHVEHPPPEAEPAPVEYVPPRGAFRTSRQIAMEARREQERYLAGW